MPPEVEWVEGLRVPQAPTLKKYGLDKDSWLEFAVDQDFVCAICFKTPKTGILHIEHEHVKGWKRMAPEKRKLYIRGLVCQFCNRFVLARTMTLQKARNIVRYLERYAKRRPQ